MSDRARLVEVMARAAYAQAFKETPRWTWETLGERRQSRWIDDQYAALAAAERAGFEFRKKEVSDGC